MKALKVVMQTSICFAYPSPFLFKRKGIINTIHDMGAWDSPDEAQTLNKYYFRLSYRHACKVSEKIITVSNFSKERICTILNVPKEKVSVIYSAVYDEILGGRVAPFETVREKYNIRINTL